jgi:hypothetical protein
VAGVAAAVESPASFNMSTESRRSRKPGKCSRAAVAVALIHLQPIAVSRRRGDGSFLFTVEWDGTGPTS